MSRQRSRRSRSRLRRRSQRSRRGRSRRSRRSRRGRSRRSRSRRSRRSQSRRKLSRKYLPRSLSRRDRAAQRRSIERGTDRPYVKSYKSRRSPWVRKFEQRYGVPITNKSWIHDNIITRAGQNKILSKGRGAYYSSGSRPNQSKDSWAFARLASVILGGPARDVDRDIWDKYRR